MFKKLTTLRQNFGSSLPIHKSNPQDFFIALDDPHRVWTPESTIQGNVILVLSQDQPAYRLECQLLGSIIIKNPLVKGKHSRYTLLEDTITLWSSNEDDNTPPVNNPPSQLQSRPSRESQESQPSQTHSPAESQSSPAQASQEPPSSNEATVTQPVLPSASSNRSIQSAASSTASINSSASSSSVTNSNVSVLNANQNSAASTPKMLPRGEHNFPFAFELPAEGLYNSLGFERGSISYVITAIYHKTGAVPTVTCKKNIKVICPLNVATLPIPPPSIFSVEVRKRKQDPGVITSMIKIPYRGYLRGESIPVTVTIKHVRPVRTPFGVVITLSRISRVRAGGLEPQSFRKDLSQTVAPLYTDPANFTAVISNRIKVPPETFSTTTGHKVVSFQYFIEAVIDLAGKWNLKMSDEETSSRLGFLDTDKLKKHRGVASLWMEIVIGTGRWQTQETSSQYPQAVDPNKNNNKGYISSNDTQRRLTSHSPHSIQSQSSQGSSMYIPRYPQGGPSTSNSLDIPLATPQYEAPNSMTPQSLASEHEQLSEKERLRRMELALLPSDPTSMMNSSNPVVVPQSIHSTQQLAPSAPPLIHSHDPHTQNVYPVNVMSVGPSSSTTSSPSNVPDELTNQPLPSNRHIAQVAQSNTKPEDKLERERRRLEALQSEPPNHLLPPPPPEEQPNGSVPSAPAHYGGLNGDSRDSAPYNQHLGNIGLQGPLNGTARLQSVSTGATSNGYHQQQDQNNASTRQDPDMFLSRNGPNQEWNDDSLYNVPAYEEEDQPDPTTAISSNNHNHNNEKAKLKEYESALLPSKPPIGRLSSSNPASTTRAASDTGVLNYSNNQYSHGDYDGDEEPTAPPLPPSAAPALEAFQHESQHFSTSVSSVPPALEPSVPSSLSHFSSSLDQQKTQHAALVTQNGGTKSQSPNTAYNVSPIQDDLDGDEDLYEPL